MISSVYDYYLSTYGNKEVSKYDSHKNSELKEVYSSMLKVNRHSPLYKFENLTSAQKYASKRRRDLSGMLRHRLQMRTEVLQHSQRNRHSLQMRILQMQCILEMMKEVQDLSLR